VAASELVDQQIKPFVDNDIRTDWLAAMHRADGAVTAAYDAAGARMDSGAAPAFEVPGELGPRWDAPDSPPVSGATVPAAAVISSPESVGAPSVAASEPMSSPAASPAASAAPASASAPFADPLPSAAAAPASAPASPMPSLGGLGGGMPSLGTGSSGFGQQLADLIGGLIGSSEDALPDPQELNPPDETDEPDGGPDEKADEKPDEEAETEPADAADESAPDEDPASPDEPEPVPPEPAATPVPPPPDPAPPIPPAVPEALPVERTPCEIAADELPQVGE
jgi:hypothetical protein